MHGAEMEGQEAADLHKERYADMDYAQEHQLAHPLGRPVGGTDGADDASEEGSSSRSGGGLMDRLTIALLPHACFLMLVTVIPNHSVVAHVTAGFTAVTLTQSSFAGRETRTG